LHLASPSRLLDTRSGVGWTSGPAVPSTPVQLRVAGRGTVPNDAAAVFVTITATGGTADGFVTAWPCDQARPLASVLNLRPGLLGSNLALVPLAASAGTICLYAYTVDNSPVHLVADAVGWLPGGPKRAPPPAPTPPPSGGSGHFGTLPVGAILPSDSQCAARVRPAGEVRSSNAVYNQTKGHLTAHPPSPIYARVDGNFTGTTDEIIQWASCKWGIDEDIVRAQVAKESWWHQSNLGDFGSDVSACAPGHPIGADGQPGLFPQSVGMMQVRYPYMTWAFNDAETSSAYNLDAALAARRECFEGQDTWLNTVERGQTYVAGDIWGCVGMWFSGRWYTQPAKDYVAAVQSYLAQKIWTTPDFLGDH
jgi:autotransporter family porin